MWESCSFHYCHGPNMQYNQPQNLSNVTVSSRNEHRLDKKHFYTISDHSLIMHYKLMYLILDMNIHILHMNVFIAKYECT